MKFQTTQPTVFFTGLKQEINAYFTHKKISKFGNNSVWIKAFLVVSAYVGAYLFLLFGNPKYQLIPYLIMGISGVLVVFNIVHDASHHAFFASKKWNNRIRYLGDLVGINTYIWDIRHNKQHHTFTNILGGDLIIENIPLIRLSPEQPWKWFHRYQMIYAPFLYMFYSLFWIFVIDFKLFFKKDICNLKNMHHPRAEWIKLFAFKILYVCYSILLPAYYAGLGLKYAIGYFLLMHFFGGILLSIVAVLGHFVEGPIFPKVEHNIIPKSWAEHELEATIDFAPTSSCMHWFTGGLNTHTAHHLFPGICHTHYKAITPIIMRYCLAHGYPYHAESFLNALKSHFRYLIKLSFKPVN